MRISLVTRTAAGAAVLGVAFHAVSLVHAQTYQEKLSVTLPDFIRLQDEVRQLDPARREIAQNMLDEAMGRMNDPSDRPSLAADYNDIVAILNGTSPYDTVGER